MRKANGAFDFHIMRLKAAAENRCEERGAATRRRTRPKFGVKGKKRTAEGHGIHGAAPEPCSPIPSRQRRAGPPLPPSPFFSFSPPDTALRPGRDSPEQGAEEEAGAQGQEPAGRLPHRLPGLPAAAGERRRILPAGGSAGKAREAAAEVRGR